MILFLMRYDSGRELPELPDTGEGARLSQSAMLVLARAYWPDDQVQNAVAIAYCESGWNPRAHNTRGEDSRGLWQINVGPGAHPHLAALNLFDPATNALHAASIWRAAGPSWRPWYNCALRLGLL